MISPSCGTLVMNCLLWLFDMAISLACQMSFLLSLFSAFWLVFFCFLTRPFLKLMPMGRHKALPLRIKLRAKPFPKGVLGFSPAGVWGIPKYLFSSFLLFRRRRNRRKEGIFKGQGPLNRLT